MSSPIQNVADTAFMVAAFRAQESARPDALFRDPLAERLAGERGRRMAAATSRGFMAGWSAIIRTVIIDDYLREQIAGGVDTVLNLGAGLDTRPYRMELPATLRWVEVDVPDTIALKERELAGETPRCQLERVPLDLAEVEARRQLFARLTAGSRKVLVLTEGVIPYLTAEAVASLADDLAAVAPVQLWIADYFSPAVFQYRERAGINKQMKNAPFVFNPPDWFAFFAQHRWHAQETRYLGERAEQLRRPLPLPLPIRIFMRLRGLFASAEARGAFKRFAGYVLLERR
jgi:methyltransferase (TIGR00027 family)